MLDHFPWLTFKLLKWLLLWRFQISENRSKFVLNWIWIGAVITNRFDWSNYYKTVHSRRNSVVFIVNSECMYLLCSKKCLVNRNLLKVTVKWPRNIFFNWIDLIILLSKCILDFQCWFTCCFLYFWYSLLASLSVFSLVYGRYMHLFLYLNKTFRKSSIYFWNSK